MQIKYEQRLELMRELLGEVNLHSWPKEALVGLSQESITRWATANSINMSSKMINSLIEISELLLFIANRSQEHIVDDDGEKILDKYSSLKKNLLCEIPKLALQRSHQP